MIVPPNFERALAAALAGAADAAADAIARKVPGDVAVTQAGSGIRLTGRRLSLRALTDPRLRDFVGLLCAGGVAR